MKTSLEFLERIRELKREILQLESTLKEDRKILLVSEEYVQKYYDGFSEEYGYDPTFHTRRHGISKPVTDQKFTHILICNFYKWSKTVRGNSVFLANRNEKAFLENRKVWIYGWDLIHKFENVTIESFDVLARKLKIDKLEVKQPNPYYEPIESFLNK